MANSTDQPCLCSQLRKTARLVSLFYDRILEPTGISITQYALLARIGRTEGLSRTVLAAQLGMDRTTLTRNLVPLERAGLITSKPGDDRREKILRLTAAGRKQAAAAAPLWAEAQEQMFKHLGNDQWQRLRELLIASEDVF